jgi:hypothetical protein
VGVVLGVGVGVVVGGGLDNLEFKTRSLKPFAHSTVKLNISVPTYITLLKSVTQFSFIFVRVYILTLTPCIQCER